MATDFRITRAFRLGILHPKKIIAAFQVILMINQVFASSVWMPQFLSGGQGRNIRHLPCVSRKTGEQGICMFAYTCMKSNGTHLGTCIDRFYFGSCCRLEGANNDLLVDLNVHLKPINNNQVFSSNGPYGTKIQTISTTSLPNLISNRYTVSSAVNNNSYLSSSPKTESPSQTSGSYGIVSSQKTDVNSAQNLVTETYVLTPSTEKIYIPIHSSSKPNKTEILSSSSGLFTTHGSSSSIFSEIKKPTTSNQGFFESTQSPSTTQSYYLSTFQVVHNGNEESVSKTPSTSFTKVTTLNPTTTRPISTWTPVKHVTQTPTVQIKRNITTTVTTPTKPGFVTTTKKPYKPVKPITSTRKPPTKKPTPKPSLKPTSKPTPKPATKPSVKPSSHPTKPPVPVKKPISTIFTTRITTLKPSSPLKPSAQPTKKPILSSSKPSTAKPPTTVKPSAPSIVYTKLNATTISSKPIISSAGTTTPTTKKTTTINSATTQKSTTMSRATFTSPIFNTFTTTETVFTKPSTASVSTVARPTTEFGITTFRPDLGATTSSAMTTTTTTTTTTMTTTTMSTTTKKPDLISVPLLTTSEGVKVTIRPTTETTQSTISNEISSPASAVASIPEAQEENTNIISQNTGSPPHPGSVTQPTTTTQNKTDSVPFFPEGTKPSSSKPPWIQIVQNTSPQPTVSTTVKTTTTTTRPTYTVIPLLPGINTSDYTQVCGRRLFPQSRVVGGEKSTFGKWPWQISLRQWRTSTYLHKCGAALLNENWAITAAHCVDNVPPSDLLLRLGEHDLSTEDEPYGFQERRVQIVASHPQFDPRTFEYDLALLRFYEPVKFQPNIIPVCVPEDSTNFVGQTAYVTGWGRLYEDGPLPSVLQEVSVPVINNTLCENMYRSAGYIEHIPEIFICAGWKKGGFDSCEGDSGGPMVIQRPDKRWLLAGVISWGIGCAEPNQPGVYTRISEFREWIHQILQF